MVCCLESVKEVSLRWHRVALWKVRFGRGGVSHARNERGGTRQSTGLGVGTGRHVRKGRGEREMSLRPGRSCKMQSFLSRDKKLGFYSKFHEKPPGSFTQGNDMI